MRYFFVCLILLGVFVRVVIHYYKRVDFPDGTVVRIKGSILTETIKFDKSQYFVFRGYKIYIPRYPEVNYGDYLEIEGVVEGKSLKNAKILKQESSDKILIGVRNRLIYFFQKSLPYQHAGLIAGVVLGSKEALDSAFWQRLKETGTVHVVVASGMNVSIVANFLISLFALVFSRRKAIFFALLGIWAYSFLSGFDAPIIRASFMGSLTFMAQGLGRRYFAERALISTALVMIFINPGWLTDIGFILSFVATGSILLLNDFFVRVFRKVPSVLRGDLSSTLSAQIGVAPILFVSFGQFNILSPLYNLAVLWTVPFMTLIGMCAGIIGLIYVPLGRLILLLTYPFTSWFIFCTNIG